MFSKSTTLILFILITTLISCNLKENQISYEDDVQAIMVLHDAQRDYHFDKNAEDFALQMAEDLISLNRGQVSTPTYEDHIRRYNRYFSAVEFEIWDDSREPVIRFSEDRSLAYTIVEKDVVLHYPDEKGAILRDSVHYAWLAIYRKGDTGAWKIESIASTNAEPVIRIIDQTQANK